MKNYSVRGKEKVIQLGKSDSIREQNESYALLINYLCQRFSNFAHFHNRVFFMNIIQLLKYYNCLFIYVPYNPLIFFVIMVRLNRFNSILNNSIV